MNPRALALRAELEKRGALSSDGKVGTIAPSFPPASRGERIKTIQNELARRGAPQTTSGAEESPPSLFKEIPQAFGKGALSGALKVGMGNALSDPMGQEMKQWMQTQEDLAPYADQHDEILKAGSEELAQRDKDAQETLSFWGRLGYNAGNWVGTSAASPLPGSGMAQGITPKAISFLKNMSKTGGLGATSQFLQEGGVNPILADMVSATLPGWAWKGGKWVFSPNYRQEAALPKVKQELGGALRETMGVPHDAKPSFILTPSGMKEAWRDVKHDFKTRKDSRIEAPVGENKDYAYEQASHVLNVPENLSPLEKHQTLPDKAGHEVRRFLLDKLNVLKRKRSAVTEPLYQELHSVKEGLEPVQARTLIDQKLKTAKGSTRSHLEKTRKELEANDPTPLDRKSLSPEQQQELTIYKQYVENAEKHPHYNPHAPNPTIGEFRNRISELEGSPSPVRQPTPGELDHTLQWLGDEISSAHKQGKDSLARELTQIKEAVEQGLESLPQGLEYREAYEHLSRPVNAIEEHRTLGRIVGEKKNTYSQQYTLSDSEIPSKVIGASLKSADDAKELMKHLKGKRGQQVKQSLQGVIHADVLKNITDEQGKVSLSKLHTWKKNHPGAFVLDAQLETKLRNLGNAQHFTDTFVAKSRNLPLLEAYQSVPSYLFKKLFRKTPIGTPILEFMHKAVGAEKNALRQELIDKALKDPHMAQILMTPVKEEGKIMQAIQKASKGGARMVFRNQEEESPTS
jgi:hypothetical protein